MEGGTLQLVDTPGHVDFSAETERDLQVLDYAVVVVSGTAGVQGHTHTLWQLLRRRHVPAFVFVNKMDAAERTRRTAAKSDGPAGRQLRRLHAPDRDEQLAVLQDELTQRFLETANSDGRTSGT
jgi:small GTP-binding protein